MQFGLFGVGSGSTVRPEPLMQVAQKAEALGYESVWIPEHLAVPVSMQTPYPYSADGKLGSQERATSNVTCAITG